MLLLGNGKLFLKVQRLAEFFQGLRCDSVFATPQGGEEGPQPRCGAHAGLRGQLSEAVPGVQ